MLKPMAWAVLCKDGSVHAGDEQSFLFLDECQARDAIRGDPWDGEDLREEDCHPHTVVTLYRRTR